MSEETKKTPQAEEPAVEPNTAEQAAPETGGCEGKAGRG